MPIRPAAPPRVCAAFACAAAGAAGRRLRHAAGCRPLLLAVAAFAALASEFRPAAAQARARQCHVVEELRIGSIDGPASLTAVTTVLPAPDGGTIYIAQPRDRQVRVHSAVDGAPIRTIGRDGAGPGEFRGVSRLSWRGDTLVVADMTQQRISLFSRAGEHLRTEAIASAPLAGTRRPAVAVALAPNGDAWGESLLDLGRIARGDATTAPIVRLARNGDALSVVGERRVAGTAGMVSAGERIAIFRQPLAEPQLRAYAPDGSAAVIVAIEPVRDDRVRFTVTRVSIAGDTLLHRGYFAPPRRVAAQQRDSILHAFATNLGGGAADAEALRVAREHVIVPAVEPAVSDVVVAGDARIWLRREALAAPQAWLVLDAAGEIETACTLPAGVRLLAAEAAHLWGAVEDELGVPYVVRLRWRPGS